ncbi:MAG: DUF134 domain-containing protein [Bacteroidota bacterium]
MPRPKNNRIVHEPPLFTEFKPVGVPGTDLVQISFTLDEYEAVRLADYIGLSHEDAADEMEISRSTFSRLVEQARKKVATFLLQGRLLTIEGGEVHFRYNIIRCQDCGHMFKINIESPVSNCPSCGSTKLINHAGGFGHGYCCKGRNQKNRR